jgi:NAD(P)-dependent dehydrogenase (short-subunit alcohol dehydrogenase family)
LVSPGGEASSRDPKLHPVAPRETSEAKRGGGNRLLLALLLAALVAVVVQGVRLQALQGQNQALAGELSTARAALDAYVNRFAEVRTFVEGLRAQLGELDVLVSADPLEPPPPPEATSEAGS